MKLDLSPRVAAAHVDLAWPLGAHLLLREKDDEAEGGAGTPLALHAVTDGDTRRLAGHLRAGRKPILTPHQQQEARKRRDAGETQRSVARSYNVSQSTISRLPALETQK